MSNRGILHFQRKFGEIFSFKNVHNANHCHETLRYNSSTARRLRMASAAQSSRCRGRLHWEEFSALVEAGSLYFLRRFQQPAALVTERLTDRHSLIHSYVQHRLHMDPSVSPPQTRSHDFPIGSNPSTAIPASGRQKMGKSLTILVQTFPDLTTAHERTNAHGFTTKAIASSCTLPLAHNVDANLGSLDKDGAHGRLVGPGAHNH